MKPEKFFEFATLITCVVAGLCLQVFNKGALFTINNLNYTYGLSLLLLLVDTWISMYEFHFENVRGSSPYDLTYLFFDVVLLAIFYKGVSFLFSYPEGQSFFELKIWLWFGAYSIVKLIRIFRMFKGLSVYFLVECSIFLGLVTGWLWYQHWPASFSLSGYVFLGIVLIYNALVNIRRSWRVLVPLGH